MEELCEGDFDSEGEMINSYFSPDDISVDDIDVEERVLEYADMIKLQAVPILLLLRQLGVARTVWSRKYLGVQPRLQDNEAEDSSFAKELAAAVEEGVTGRL